jgi:hypothetical protein
VVEINGAGFECEEGFGVGDDHGCKLDKPNKATV